MADSWAKLMLYTLVKASELDDKKYEKLEPQKSPTKEFQQFSLFTSIK